MISVPRCGISKQNIARVYLLAEQVLLEKFIVGGHRPPLKNGAFQTRKPTRTAAELEALKRRELREVYGGFSSSPVTVSPDGESWKVVFSRDTSIDRFETTLLVSDRLRSHLI